MPQVRREGQRYRCQRPLSGLAEWRRAATGSSVASRVPATMPAGMRPRSGVNGARFRLGGTSAGMRTSADIAGGWSNWLKNS